MGQLNCTHLEHVSVAKQTVGGRVLWVEMTLLYSLALNDFSTRLKILPSSLDTTELFGKSGNVIWALEYSVVPTL